MRSLLYNRGMENMNGIHGTVTNALLAGLDKPPKLLNPLVLAYIGDTVYDLFVRTSLIHTTDYTAHGLHRLSVSRVKASAQAEAFHRIEGMLNEDELYIYKRGRNVHPHTMPKNASMGDYRVATGMEALIGYLYLSGADDRLTELMGYIINDK